MTSNSIYRAALWMSGAVLCFSAMAIAGREAGRNLDTFEIMTFRSLVGLLLMVAILTATRKWAEVSRQNLPRHVLRNLFHFTGQNLWFYAITVIPLAQVFALEFTSPIWVAFLSPFLLKEALTKPRMFAVSIGFVGVLITVRPSFDMVNSGVIAATSAAIFFALTMIFTRRLTQKESTLSILFWLTLMQLVIGLICVFQDGKVTIPLWSDLPFFNLKSL